MPRSRPRVADPVRSGGLDGRGETILQLAIHGPALRVGRVSELVDRTPAERLLDQVTSVLGRGIDQCIGRADRAVG